ncbi:MAG: glutathione S-transferase family protein [Myxococcales bacterium]|nr:glutathione S-transferase family protein [Myxococcales bacterium]HIL81246.1 glutathione S-transferase family protein [Myxococcales bacterium]
MLKIWGRASAVNVQKAMWAVGETGAPFERIDLGGKFGGLDDPGYVAKNPNRRVPTLEDDGLVLYESGAIVRYLAAKYSPENLWSQSEAERALIDQWMEWTVSTLYPDFITLFWLVFRTPIADRNLPRIASINEAANKSYAILEEHLEGRDYLVGNRFTAADIPAGMTLYRYFEMKEIEIPSLPNVRNWYQRLCERPAYQAHVMLDFEELRGRLDF